MSSASPAPEAGASQWKEYKNSEGRIYWSHAVTKQSVWEKPDELKTPFERAMTKTPWKQFTSRGKPYYVNSLTKETVWELPSELIKLQEKVEAQEMAKREREHRKNMGDASPSPSGDSRSPSPSIGYEHSTALTRRRSSGSRTPVPAREVETVTIPPGGFTTHEKAEAAFIHLLKREGVDETWSWDTTMRRIVLDPLYKALDTLAQKKAAYEKWQDQLRKEKEAAKAARLAELRPLLTRLFAHSGLIKSYSTIKTADKAFAGDKNWRRAKPDERRLILEDYVSDLRTRENERLREEKTHNVAALGRILKTLEITVTTRWRTAHDLILRSDAFRADPTLGKMDTLDMLTVYDDHARVLEREHDEDMRRQRVQYARRARKARDGFKALLRELREKGDLTPTSKWKDMYPKIREDARYKDLLGLPGSSPMDLWMDAVDDLQLEAEEAAARVEKALETAGDPSSSVTLSTSWDEFAALCDTAKLGPEYTEAQRRSAFGVIHARLARVAADEARRAERRKRHRIEDLRDALRHARVDIAGGYDAALEAMKEMPEFKAIEDDEDRKAAWDKYERRVKERASEGESSRRGSERTDRDRFDRDRRDRDRMDVDMDDRRRRSDRDWRDRSDYRDRDRDYRSRDDRDRDRDRERDRHSRGDRRSERRDDRDRDRERERDRDRHRRDSDASERDPKRRRISASATPGRVAAAALPATGEEREEGEI